MTAPRRLALLLALLPLACHVPPAAARQGGRAEDRAGGHRAAGPAGHGTVRHYDGQGRSLGRSAAGPSGSIRHYDAAGRSLGRTEVARDGSARHHDAQGRLVGRSERR